MMLTVMMLPCNSGYYRGDKKGRMPYHCFNFCPVGTADYIWTGGQKKPSYGKWRWVANGKAFTYTNWASGWHDNSASSDCVFYQYLDGAWRWDDYSCSYRTRSYALCEINNSY